MEQKRFASHRSALGVGRVALRIAVLVLGLAILAGCGGADSGSSGDPGRFAGTYSGTFEGDDAGTFTVTVDDQGAVTGDGESDTDGAFTITGTVDGAGALAGATSLGATWTGIFGETGVDGNWTNDANSGTFTADPD